jgi:hypothetical protein
VDDALSAGVISAGGAPANAGRIEYQIKNMPVSRGAHAQNWLKSANDEAD